MSLIEEELEKTIDKKIVVVMTDGKKFLGRLSKYDSKILVLHEVLELSDRFQWVLPMINTARKMESPINQDIIESSERGYLDEVIVNTRHILRIWPWEPKRLD